MKKLFISLAIVAGFFAVTSCGSSGLVKSKGEKAADEVIVLYNSLRIEEAAQLMEKYMLELSDKDKLDFFYALEEAGITD